MKFVWFLTLALSTVSVGAWKLKVDAHIYDVDNTGDKQEKDDFWDSLVLTQSWPPAACIYIEDEKKQCNISSSIRSWVIHGLWPTKMGTEGPNFCNKTWKFDLSEVQELRPRLDYNWPSITLHEKAEETWKHEWEKHGTCGASLEAIKDEIHYFNVTLGLHQLFNISQFLAKSGILPSDDQTYDAENILSVLKQTLGEFPSIACVKEKTSGKFYLEQVEVCLDKTFQPISCKSAQGRLPLKQRPDDLLFVQEDLVSLSQKSDPNIHDCGDGQVYYKPLPKSRKKVSFVV